MVTQPGRPTSPIDGELVIHCEVDLTRAPTPSADILELQTEDLTKKMKELFGSSSSKTKRATETKTEDKANS